ncbi:DUF1330 domain-containing protein [Deinococcus cellulosilyticus]|uniref:DUF1330 domain-containing protein n=1 Tax=Deinococcus cellulosilyticus (strain DSM 18568 / NBRC 106333 / KACC 11606 / 5516J-15) TaxID=1223518 RepID=A0A511MZE2_DEIC1|nr:DUF1330 domain-containing protein [Deinococcus cellulosilyticus]GEM45990.1 hypothetical protein DC3_16250 [Deinococcus cellulosilyticus NBRC 106333 = KACC 11606]
MPAYIIVNTRVSDPTRIQEYRDLAQQSVHQYGGRYLVRGGPMLMLEGEYHPERLVVLEFDSLERIREWYASEAYQKAKAARDGIAQFDMIAVEGLDVPL